MSVVTHQAEDGTAALARMLRTLLRVVRTAIEAHAEYRAKSAMASTKLQQADREMRRCRRLMRGGK
jgi:hypothetical protein